MEPKTRHWGVLAFLIFIAVIMAAQKPIGPGRTKARRAQMVNASPKWAVSFVLTNLNATNTSAFPVQPH